MFNTQTNLADRRLPARRVRKKTKSRKKDERQARQISLLKYLQVLRLNPYMNDLEGNDQALNHTDQQKLLIIKNIQNAAPKRIDKSANVITLKESRIERRST